MKVDVVLLYRLSAIVESVKSFSGFCREFSGCKGMGGLFVRNDAIDVVAFPLPFVGIVLLDEVQLCTVCPAAYRRPLAWISTLAF